MQRGGDDRPPVEELFFLPLSHAPSPSSSLLAQTSSLPSLPSLLLSPSCASSSSAVFPSSAPSTLSHCVVRGPSSFSLLVGGHRSVHVIHASEVVFQPNLVSSEPLHLAGLEDEDEFSISCLCTFPRHGEESACSFAVSIIRAKTGNKEGALLVYGESVPQDGSVHGLGRDCTRIPTSFEPCAMASIATRDGKNVHYVLIISGLDGSLSVCSRSQEEPKEKARQVGPSVAKACSLQDASSFLDIIPEVALLQRAGPLCSISVKYLGRSRHVAAGSLLGTVCYSNVNMADNSVVRSQIVCIDGPISAVLLFSSFEDIAQVAGVRDHPFKVAGFKEYFDEEFHEQITSHSSCGENNQSAAHHRDFDPFVESSEGGLSFMGDGHLLVCTALGYGVLYQDVLRHALLEASFLPGIRSAVDNDALLCACIADLELDGIRKLLVGSYSGRVLVYRFSHRHGVEEDADNAGDRSQNASPLNSISSGGFSAEPVLLSSSIQETFGSILQPFPGENSTFTDGLRERLECVEADSASKLSSAMRGENLSDLKEAGKAMDTSVAGSLTSETGYLAAQVGKRTESPISVSGSSSPIPILQDSEMNTTQASKIPFTQFLNTNSNLKRSLDREASLPVTPSSGFQSLCETGVLNSRLGKASKPAPWNEEGTQQGSGIFRRVESEKDIRSAIRSDAERDYRKFKNDLESDSNDSEDVGWFATMNQKDPLALSYVFHAGGPVLGMYWVDMTRDGLRDLVIIIHDGIRILQCELEYVVRRLREKLVLLRGLRSIEKSFVENHGEFQSQQ
eukprot:766967-Hanusia_phi.AAC.5